MRLLRKRVKKDLTFERLRELLHYDPLTGIFRWRISRPKQRIIVGDLITGTVDKNGYKRISVDDWQYASHRLAWFYMTGVWPTKMLDHINGDPVDNCWNNIREVSYSESNMNRRTQKTNKLGVKGVFRTENGKFCAQINANGKLFYLGRHSTLVEAESIYNEFARKLHGSFRREQQCE